MTNQTIEIIDGKIKPMDVFKIIDHKFKYVAMDRDKSWCAYRDKPNLCWPKWSVTSSCSDISFFLDIAYTGKWKDSLHERPKKLKPVNNNCCGKKILVPTCEEVLNKVLPEYQSRRILVYCEIDNDEPVYWCVDLDDEKGFRGDKRAVEIVRWNFNAVKRCPDVIYGDEDE